MVNWLIDRYHAFVEWSRMRRLESYWRASGHPNPGTAAVEEMHRRIALEKFRDFASARYVQDPTLSVAEIKLEYYQWVTPDTLKAQPTSRTALDMEIEAVGAMLNCFVGEAKAIHDARSAEQSKRDLASLKGSRIGRPAYETRARRGRA
ncbi:hypothetical protein NKJ09_23035 [Mesorhizobium sp. M0189]|uniref:hypothetical protein n=1 Tax=Mesorhizobium sp. M0189 TaxID=2956909 RepID=UPI003334DAD6